jgi:CheY-like chemotaxis protein
LADKILVVDDELAVRDLLRGFLTKEGYEVIEAADGEKAVEVARQESPQVILLDVKMPGVDGIEACKRLKADTSTRLIPIIMVTAYDDKAVDAYLEGADDFVKKPFDMAELSLRLKSVLRIRHLTDELERATAYRKELKHTKEQEPAHEFSDDLFDDLEEKEGIPGSDTPTGDAARQEKRQLEDRVVLFRAKDEVTGQDLSAGGALDSASIKELSGVICRRVEAAVSELLAEQLPAMVRKILEEEIE